MDTPRQFPSDDEFNELTDIRVRNVGKNSQRRVVSGVQLEAHVLAFEAHRSNLDWARSRVAEMLARLLRLLREGVRL